MTPTRSATENAQAFAEGINCLAVFLCGPALRSVGPDAAELFRHFQQHHAPAFRKLDVSRSGMDAAGFRAALQQISAIAPEGLGPGSAQLAPLREAIRELFTALRIPLPAPGAPGATRCELHGEACPVLAQDGA